MSRRLPADNGVVGQDERDDPGRVLRGGALAGGRGRVDLGALVGPSDGVVVEPAAASPVLVHLGEHGAHHPDGRLPAREHLHDAAAALELAVGAPLHVASAKPDVVLVGEIEVGQRVGLRRPAPHDLHARARAPASSGPCPTRAPVGLP